MRTMHLLQKQMSCWAKYDWNLTKAKSHLFNGLDVVSVCHVFPFPFEAAAALRISACCFSQLVWASNGMNLRSYHEICG